ncbi:MAG: FHA domain-containing protein [Bacteroidetes bacterium]|nr:MAG: FHA domain-containing protein [Bacteroidota bacterium]
MKKVQYLLTIIIFFLVYSVTAQQKDDKKETGKEDFRIVKTDTAGYPLIKTSIEMISKIQPIKGDFVIQDETGNKANIITFEKKGEEGKTATSSRLIYFLLDASAYTSGTPITTIKNSVKESFAGGLNKESDLINVGYFGHDNLVKNLERDFGSNYSNFESDINSITASNDTTGKLPDANKAIYDAIDYFRKSDKTGQKILIVISGAINKEKTAYKRDNIIDRAKKVGVNIYTINYKIDKFEDKFFPDDLRIMSDKTDAEYKNVTESTEIKNALDEFLKSARSSTTTEDATLRCEISFEVPNVKDGAEHSFKIVYKGQEVNGYFTAPGDKGSSGIFGILNGYGFIIVIVIGLLIGGVAYWQYNEARLRKLEEEEMEAQEQIEREQDEKRREREHQNRLQTIQEQNIRLQEQLKMKEQELARKIDEVPTVIPASKIDPKKTMIGGGGGAPVLQVVAGAFSKNYRLNKPTMTIGRAANNDIIIPEQTVSSHHATLTIENGNFFISDINSTNGTFVNGTRIDKKMLKGGDLLKLGGASCKFEIV